jgi:hypothetical protein
LGDVECVVQWQSGPANVWVEHCGARFGFHVTDLSRLSTFAAPTDMRRSQISEALTDVVDDDRWVGQLLEGNSPAHAPFVRPPWRSLALVQAAEAELNEQISPAVLELDRALALDRIGANDQAVDIASGRLNTAIEVVELLHDAGVVTMQIREDLLRLLQLVDNASLRRDLLDGAANGYRNDAAIEDIFREVLTPPAPPALLDAAEREQVALSEQQLVNTWRTRRRIRASEQSLTGSDIDGDTESVRFLFDEERKAARDQLGARVLELSLNETFGSQQPEGDPPPLLAELIFCLLSVRGTLEGSLTEAAQLDLRKSQPA